MNNDAAQLLSDMLPATEVGDQAWWVATGPTHVAVGCHPTWPLCRYRHGKREAQAGAPWRGLTRTPF